MSIEQVSLNRRHLLQGLGRIAAIAAVAPVLFGSRAADGHVADVLAPGSPASVGMCADRIEDVFARLERRANDKLFPGAVALIARRGRIVGHRAFGTRVAGEDEPVTLDTLFDLESMTKVLATATAALVLVQDGALRLDDPVVAYLPSFTGAGKAGITVRDMLRYSAGLPMDNQFLDIADDEAVFQLMAETPLEYAPGTQVLYSDLTYRLLGRIVEVAAGMNLDAFAKARIWGPLGMVDTTFNPAPALIPRIAATGYSESRGYVVRGEVEDEQDFALGGIAGCDGVFSTARDIAVFCQMALNQGKYGGARVLGKQLAKQMVKNQTPQVSAAATDVSPIANLISTPKGYGWELATRRFSNGGTRLSPGSYGKAGGAGTFMWIDPDRDLFGILLTNHGLPKPFDEIGWNRMLDAVGCAEFFDGIIHAVEGP
jgi:CubicO group peptidase (beta-lactamase class C family)